MEWSFVRKSLRTHPRRFSQSFVASEVAKLNLHRTLVRDVQRGKYKKLPVVVCEIPALISVGSTVTAYHKKTRMIQRGVVLSQDRIKPGYVVMFDRKELGCDFCPDTDVASHGPPNICVQSTNKAVDGSAIGGLNDTHQVPGSLPYGTMHNMDVGKSSHPLILVSSGPFTHFYLVLNSFRPDTVLNCLPCNVPKLRRQVQMFPVLNRYQVLCKKRQPNLKVWSRQWQSERL